MMAEFFRFLSPLAEPLGLVWLLQWFLALALAWRRRWLGALALVMSAVVFSILGASSLAKDLLASLERPYVRANWNEVPAADAVVLLGGGHRFSQYDVFGFDLGEASDRILTAVELMRQRKGRALALSGGIWRQRDAVKNPAILLQAWFVAWNLPIGQAFYLPPCRNTHEEAEAVQELARQQKWQRILLVTSAFHLRRAAAVFQSTGLAVTGVGCDFQAEGIPEEDRWYGPVPRLARFQQLSLYLHEELGWWFYKLNGWTEKRQGYPLSGQTNSPTSP